MYGTVSGEKAMKVGASEAWKLIGSLELAKLMEASMPEIFRKIEVVEGDGGAGTILHVSFGEGMFKELGRGEQWLKEKFTVVDEEKRVKETEVVEGGYLKLGFTLYRFRVEVIQGEEEKLHCVVRSTIEYELKQEAAANASLALASTDILTAVMQLAAHHLHPNSINN